MKEKLKEYFKKNDNMTDIEKEDYNRKMNIIKLIGCVIFIAVMIVYVNLMPKNNAISNNNNDIDTIETDNIIAELSEIKENYKQKVTISKDLEDLVVEREVLGSNEAGRQLVNNKETNYILYDNVYYIITEEVPIKKDETFDPYLGNDTTFININNLLELINTTKETAQLSEENYKIKRYKISLSDLIVIYNKVNNAEISLKENKKLDLNINYNQNIESIELDLTELFNLISEKKYREVIYKIEYSNIEEIDLDGIDELIKLAK